MKPPSTLNCSLQALDFQQAWSPLDFVTPGHTSRPFEFLRKLLSPFPFLFPSRYMRAYIIIELSRKLKSGQRGSKRGNIRGKFLAVERDGPRIRKGRGRRFPRLVVPRFDDGSFHRRSSILTGEVGHSSR